MAIKFKALDVTDFPSDPNRVFGDTRKHLLTSIRKCRRRYDDGHGDYILQLKELLDFAQEVLDDYSKTEDTTPTTPEPAPVVRDKPKPKTRAKRKAPNKG